jgi:hypothetical protein
LFLEPIAERASVTPVQAAFLALVLSGGDQVLEAPAAGQSGRATLSAAFVAELTKLIFALPRKGQVSELVFDFSSHRLFF